MAYPTVDTLSTLIDEVQTNLQGFGTANDQVTTLTSTLAADATSFTVADTDGMSRGVVEIDDEIMYVDRAENGTVTVPPWGRGYKGTIPSAHSQNVAVWIAPTWPRATVAREVNNTIRAVYPDLFGVSTVDFSAGTTTWQYPLPADCERILSVEWRWSTPFGWNTLFSWEMVNASQVSEFPTGKSLVIGDAIPTSGTLHITYAKIPTLLSAPSTPFTDSGLAASARDVIVLGTAAKLVPWQDTARLPVETVPSDAQDIGKPVGMATQVAGSIRQQYVARLAAERRVLLNKYPTKAHRTR